MEAPVEVASYSYCYCIIIIILLLLLCSSYRAVLFLFLLSWKRLSQSQVERAARSLLLRGGHSVACVVFGMFVVIVMCIINNIIINIGISIISSSSSSSIIINIIIIIIIIINVISITIISIIVLSLVVLVLSLLLLSLSLSLVVVVVVVVLVAEGAVAAGGLRVLTLGGEAISVCLSKPKTMIDLCVCFMCWLKLGV